MSYSCFDLSITDAVAHIVLNRPEKRNSMVPEFWSELPAIIRDIDNNSKARVIVISSTGPHFSSGMDLSAFSQSPELSGDTPSDQQDTARMQHGARFMDSVSYFQESFNAIEDCRIPVIAAIQGGCLGGGVDMVTACDMRYATEDAFICIQEINIGMTADVGTFPRLVKLIPEGIVRELAYTGRRLPAKEAMQAGLVNRVFVDQETMLKEVLSIAAEIASKAPLAVYGSKRMINYARDHSTADALDYIGVWNTSMLQGKEMQEAMLANMEKRPGTFVELPKRRAR